MRPWKLGSKYMKYKLKLLRPDKFWAHRAFVQSLPIGLLQGLCYCLVYIRNPLYV